MSDTLRLLQQVQALLEENAWLRGALLPSNRSLFRGLEDLGLGLIIVLDALLQAECPVPASVLCRRISIAKRRRNDLTLSAVFSVIDRLRLRLGDLTPPIEISVARGRGYFLDKTNKTRLAARRIQPASPAKE